MRKSLAIFLFNIFCSASFVFALPAPNDRIQLTVLNAGLHHSGHRYLSEENNVLPEDVYIEFLVIGSGYGASVDALRLAEALSQTTDGVANRLAVFERGQEWLPGSFPKNALELAGALRTPVNQTGLIDVNTSNSADIDVIGANGLGGTSLLNAAIVLDPPNNVWEQPEWPLAIRSDFLSGLLSKFYLEAHEMLKPNYGPRTRQLPKTVAHLANAELGVPTGELTLAINHDEGRECHGVTQRACNNCGNCCGGCNVGAKNTLTTNYLPAAKNLGAKIFTKIEVESIEKLTGNGPRYRVHYIRYSQNALGLIQSQRGTVTSNHVFLGAGSAGSTKILLKSRQNGLALSPALGTRVSANGDVLGFMYNSRTLTNIAAAKNSDAPENEILHPVGQTITAYHDYRITNQNRPIEEQFVLLDGSAPVPFAGDLAKAFALTSGGQTWLSHGGRMRIADDAICLWPTQKGALNHSMVLLACGHDSSGGTYVLNGGSLSVTWTNVLKEHSFVYINQKMREYSERMGGRYISNPRSSFMGGEKIQATHPLGGVPMGDSVQTGVVDHLGRVYNPEGGFYDGLYVHDASIIPRSLAAPPLATITALAERAMWYITNMLFDNHGCELPLLSNAAQTQSLRPIASELQPPNRDEK